MQIDVFLSLPAEIPDRLIGSMSKRIGVVIDLIHKWRPIYYSFIFMLISLP